MAEQVFEFRGVDNLYIAEVLKDDATGYVTETPVLLITSRRSKQSHRERK